MPEKSPERLTPMASAVSGCQVLPPTTTPEIEGVRATFMNRLPVAPLGAVAKVMMSGPFKPGKVSEKDQ